MRIAILIWLALAAAAGSRAQSWERLGPEGGMVLSLGIDSAGTVRAFPQVLRHYIPFSNRSIMAHSCH